MKQLLLLILLTTLSSCSHSPTPIVPVQHPEKTIAWKECQDGDLCILVPAECGQPRAINVNTLEAYKGYITGISNIIMCNGLVAHLWDSGLTAKCKQGSCSPVKMKVKSDVAKLPKSLSKKVIQHYDDALMNKTSGDWMGCMFQLQEIHTIVEEFKDSKSLFPICTRMQMSGLKSEKSK